MAGRNCAGRFVPDMTGTCRHKLLCVCMSSFDCSEKRSLFIPLSSLLVICIFAGGAELKEKDKQVPGRSVSSSALRLFSPTSHQRSQTHMHTHTRGSVHIHHSPLSPTKAGVRRPSTQQLALLESQQRSVDTEINLQVCWFVATACSARTMLGCVVCLPACCALAVASFSPFRNFAYANVGE